MNEKEKTIDSPTRPRFASQWAEYEPTEGQIFVEPSCTIPDQSMTIPQIIARFTRTGMVPGTISMRDNGGNVAADPESDPLDDWNNVQDAAIAAKAAKAADGSSKDPSADPSGESGEHAPAGAGADMRTYFT